MVHYLVPASKPRQAGREERRGGLHDDRSSTNLDGWLLQVLITPEGQADPYPYYALMRDEARVSRTSFGPYVVNGYDECQAVLRDPRLGRGMALEDASTGIFGETGTRRGEFFEVSQHNMLLADPPDHTRLRRLVSRSFTPRQVERLRPAVHDLVADLLDTMADKGDVDFMSDFALPLPMAVIGELVGVPVVGLDRPPALRPGRGARASSRCWPPRRPTPPSMPSAPSASTSSPCSKSAAAAHATTC